MPKKQLQKQNPASREEIEPGGILVIDKPAGLSSHDIVGRMRWLLQTRRVGHAGTLDPFATGVLVVCIGRATRLVPWLTKTRKRYQATLRFGATSTTDDPEGEITLTEAALPTEDDLRAILPDFTGTQQQRPPSFSAIRVNGRRAYKIARKGREVEMPQRTVHVESLSLVSCTLQEGLVLDAVIDVTCGSGTYIRALARDMGAALGCGAYLTALRRTGVGQYDISQAFPLSKDKTTYDAAATRAHMLPVREVQLDVPFITLDEVESQRFLQGQRLAGRDDPEVEEIALRDPQGLLLGFGAVRDAVLHPLVVLG